MKKDDLSNAYHGIFNDVSAIQEILMAQRDAETLNKEISYINPENFNNAFDAFAKSNENASYLFIDESVINNNISTAIESSPVYSDYIQYKESQIHATLDELGIGDPAAMRAAATSAIYILNEDGKDNNSPEVETFRQMYNYYVNNDVNAIIETVPESCTTLYAAHTLHQEGLVNNPDSIIERFVASYNADTLNISDTMDLDTLHSKIKATLSETEIDSHVQAAIEEAISAKADLDLSI